jgi:phenylacetate-CoA ligase
MLATAEIIHEAAMPHRLAELLPSWLQEVPLYQGYAKAFGPQGEPIHPEVLKYFPLITKQDIRRDFPKNFLKQGTELQDLLDQELVEVEHTSGTSEARTPLLLELGWWSEQESKVLRLNPFVARVLDEIPNPRRVTTNSPMCSNDIRYTGVPSRDERIVGNSLFSSLSRLPFLWSETDLARMAAEAEEWDPVFLDVDPVYGVVFAQYCERHGIRLPSLRFIIASYEYVSVVHRRILERVFKVPVFNLYGSTETGHLLMESESGWMKPAAEAAVLQVINEDEQNTGDLVVTTLTNKYMPLIRYRIGDLVMKKTEPYGTRYLVHGRAADAVRKPDGTRATVWHIDHCFSDLIGVAHYQLVEQSERDFSLRFVPDREGPDRVTISAIRERLGRVLDCGERLVVEPTDLLMPESSGKFRLSYPAPEAK